MRCVPSIPPNKLSHEFAQSVAYSYHSRGDGDLPFPLVISGIVQRAIGIMWFKIITVWGQGNWCSCDNGKEGLSWDTYHGNHTTCRYKQIWIEHLSHFLPQVKIFVVQIPATIFNCSCETKHRLTSTIFFDKKWSGIRT